MDHANRNDTAQSSSRRGKWVLIGFLLIAGFFLWTEHRAHLLGILPYLLFAACPLMHLFHHGHGHHGRGAPEASNTRHNGGEAGGQKP